MFTHITNLPEERVFLISDTHFWHKNILHHCQRPFSSVEEMNRSLIENWNYKVNPQDEVFHCGDFSFNNISKNINIDILSQLNGKKYLIIGNHDNKNLITSEYWIRTFDLLHLQTKENHYILCHYPLEAWYLKFYGSYHLHGHIHTKDFKPTHYNPRKLDIGVDYNNYSPISLKECKEKLNYLESFISQNSIMEYF